MKRLFWALLSTVLLTSTLAASASAQVKEDARLDLPPIDRAAARTTQGARDLAIVVAVENYQSLPAVPGAVLTGMDWKVFFSEHLGMSNDRILFLKDHKATPSKLEREIPRFLKKANRDARVWFVFVGHGAPYQAVEGDAQVSDGLLVGVNAFNDTYADFVDGSLRKSKLEKMLAAGRQQQTVMVLDACFSGRTADNQNLTGTQAVIPSKVIPKVGPQDIVFSAAAHNEVANLIPGNTVKRPAFSYVLLGALRGWADRDGDQQVSLAEAEAYSQRALLGLQTPSASVADNSIKNQPLVVKAPEADPGARTLFKRVVHVATDYSDKPCPTTGKIRNVDTQGECCWPGQGYSSMAGACVGTPACPDGMAAGDDDQCHRVAGQTADTAAGEEPSAATDEPASAAAVDRGECSTPEGCNQLGEDAQNGGSGPPDTASAGELYKKACDGGDATGCFNLGSLHEEAGTPTDLSRSSALYEKACHGGHPEGCRGLGNAYLNGKGVIRSDARATEAFKKGCELGELYSCVNVGRAHVNGTGVPKDPPRGLDYLERACVGGHAMGCTVLGAVYYEGYEGVPKDRSRAHLLFNRACRGGEQKACGFAQKQRRSRGGCAGFGASGFVVVFLVGMGGLFRRRWF